MAKTREEILQKLRGRIGDGDYNRINQFFPTSPSCPTCDGSLRYKLDGDYYDCDCEVQKLLQRHYFAANIGREYHDINLDDFNGSDRSKVVPIIENYIETFQSKFHYGIGITLSGPVGTGKTFAMACVLKELIKDGWKCYTMPFDEMINVWGSAYQDNDSKRMLDEKLKSVDILGLDEVHTDKRNYGGFLALGFDSIIRHRTANLLPTIVTTNMTQEEEIEEFGKAYSLLSARNIRITTTGKDVRKDIIRFRIMELDIANERRPIC